MIEFLENPMFISSYGLGSEGEYIPVYMIKNNVKYFVHNLIKQIKGDTGTWMNLKNERNIEEDKRLKKQLVETDGKYLTFHSQYDNPFDYLQWVKENNYSLLGDLYRESTRQEDENQFTDFHGNLKEYSAAFHYRIFDQDMLRQIKEIVNTCNRAIDR